MNKRVLVVEDDWNLAERVQLQLQQAGYAVRCVHSGQEALQAISEQIPHCLVLDWGLPDMEGIDLCRMLRFDYTFPIVMISEKTAEIDAVVALELGATDYMRKPVGCRELITRVRLHIARHEREILQQTRMAELCIGPFKVDLMTFKVFKEAQEIILTRGEFKLLVHLFEHPGNIQSREEIIETLQFTKGDRRVVDVLIRRLRIKIEENPKKPKWIKTKTGVGYYFNDHTEKLTHQ